MTLKGLTKGNYPLTQRKRKLLHPFLLEVIYFSYQLMHNFYIIITYFKNCSWIDMKNK
jgi:hypothetical protein